MDVNGLLKTKVGVGADLYRADLSGAKLYDADLSGANLYDIITNKNTIMPKRWPK